jgi:hypothetical protein
VWAEVDEFHSAIDFAVVPCCSGGPTSWNSSVQPPELNFVGGPPKLLRKVVHATKNSRGLEVWELRAGLHGHALDLAQPTCVAPYRGFHLVRWLEAEIILPTPRPI